MDLVEDLLLGPGLDGSTGGVGLYRPAVTGAQGQGGRPLPVVDEPVNRLQGCDLLGLGVDEHAEGAAGLDGGELVGVPDAQHLGAGRVSLGDDLVQGDGGGHGGLVNDDEVTGLQPRPRGRGVLDAVQRGIDRCPDPPVGQARGGGVNDREGVADVRHTAALVDPLPCLAQKVHVAVALGGGAAQREPHGDVVGRRSQGLAEDLGGRRGGGQGGDRPGPVLGLPGIHQSGQGGGLAGAGGPNHEVQAPATGGHGLDSGQLILTGRSLPSARQGPWVGQLGRVGAPAPAHQSVLGVQEHLGREDLRVLRHEPAGAVTPAVAGGGVRGGRVVHAHAPGGDRLGQAASELIALTGGLEADPAGCALGLSPDVPGAPVSAR